MRNLATFAFLAALFATAGHSAIAMDSMMSGSMSSMPKCRMGDKMVGVNTMTKMYLTQDQLKSKMAGMSMAKQHEMMMKNHVKMMCKSKADAMGGKMMH